ncbi:hypothetical protein [Silvibacterium dinghuense]|uniref:DUF948 domain-containing protein n=1 Tax=Silvibacterium dinghuense TaxID=1560006 RepID=A0A4Q1SH11_9BACT|nr:hypothetical protein [Silvibacterium dinghuense]RXS96637.1 hypothetical protein ESZ00_01430 [Silvibacterium dinghuense]GGG92450.1 hypothetical protein GCM10011586_03920 [Silvibacterium dinghuense]
MHSQLPQIVQLLFTVVTAVGILLQALVLLGMYFAVRQSAKKLQALGEEVKVHLVPTLITARKLLDDVAPKLKIATSNLVEVSHALRHESTQVQATVDGMLSKTNAQAERVNEMLTAVLDSVEHATAVLQHSVATPVRRFSGIVAGVRAGFSTLRRKEKPPAATEVETAEEVPDGQPVTVLDDLGDLPVSHRNTR